MHARLPILSLIIAFLVFFSFLSSYLVRYHFFLVFLHWQCSVHIVHLVPVNDLIYDTCVTNFLVFIYKYTSNGGHFFHVSLKHLSLQSNFLLSVLIVGLLCSIFILFFIISTSLHYISTLCCKSATAFKIARPISNICNVKSGSTIKYSLSFVEFKTFD